MFIQQTDAASDLSLKSLDYPHSESANLKTEKADKTHIPRENMSLPSNMQLHDLSTLRKGERCPKAKTSTAQKQMVHSWRPCYPCVFSMKGISTYAFSSRRTDSQNIYILIFFFHCPFFCFVFFFWNWTLNLEPETALKVPCCAQLLALSCPLVV